MSNLETLNQELYNHARVGEYIPDVSSASSIYDLQLNVKLTHDEIERLLKGFRLDLDTSNWTQDENYRILPDTVANAIMYRIKIRVNVNTLLSIMNNDVEINKSCEELELELAHFLLITCSKKNLNVDTASLDAIIDGVGEHVRNTYKRALKGITAKNMRPNSQYREVKSDPTNNNNKKINY